MLYVSFATVLMAVLSCGVIMAFVAVCFTNKKLLVYMNYTMFSLLPGIAILHLTSPLGLSFNSNVTLLGSLSRVIAYLNGPIFTVGSLDISIWRMFGFIWAVGCIICLVKLIRKYIMLKHTVALYGKDVIDVIYEGRRPEVFDILLKVAVNLLIIIFWWNPACYLLRIKLSVF